MRHVYKCAACGVVAAAPEVHPFPDAGEMEKMFLQFQRFGVKSFSNLDGVLHVEFHPPQEAKSAPRPALPMAEELSENAEMCRCGHEIHAHGGEGLCLRGCKPEECAEPKADDDGKTP